MGSPGHSFIEGRSSHRRLCFYLLKTSVAHWAALMNLKGLNTNVWLWMLQLEGGEWMQSEIYALK